MSASASIMPSVMMMLSCPMQASMFQGMISQSGSMANSLSVVLYWMFTTFVPSRKVKARQSRSTPPMMWRAEQTPAFFAVCGWMPRFTR